MIDGRLLVPAAGAWGSAALALVLLGTIGSPGDRHAWALRTLAVAAVLVVVVIASIALALLASSRCHGGKARSPRVVVAAVAIGGVLLGVTVAALHVLALTAEPLSTWVAARATATVRGVVLTEPILRTNPGAAIWQGTTRTEVRLATSEISARGDRVDVDVPIVVRLPPVVAVPPPGSEVDLVGRLSAATPAQQAAATLTVDGDAAHVIVRSAPGWVDTWAHAMRTGLRRALVTTSPRAGALVAGLAVGDESLQPPELGDQMRASGLSHLTAVSGGNVAIIVMLVLGLASALRLSLALRVTAALVALAFFVVLVGPQPSVLRAAAMGGLVLIGLLAGGRRAGPSVLSASVLLLVVLDPGLAMSWGLALSAFATAGLILLSPIVQAWLARSVRTRRWPPAVRDALAITTAAQVATLPLLVAMGAAVGWVCLPANLLAMPVVAPVTVLGLLSAMLAPVAMPAATVLAHAAAWPAGWIAEVAQVASGLPLATLPWPAGPWGLVALAAAAVGGWLGRRSVRRAYPDGIPRLLVGVALVLAACLVGLWVLAPPDRRGWPPSGWFLLMCDVGQGDAILIRSGERSAIVVDAGPDPDRVDRCLDDAGIAAVPAVVLTHFHADHVDGLSGVFRGRDVAAVFVTPIRDPPDEAAAVDGWVRDQGLSATVLTAGDVRSVGPVAWRVLWPRRLVASGSVPNNASLVLAVDVDGHRVLLSGDIEPEAQAAISADLRALRFDVVKVPHHGSRYQHPLFTTWAPARVALISVGAGNTYGHPAADTIASWTRLGALVARTDDNGDIAVVDDGTAVSVTARHGMLPSS